MINQLPELKNLLPMPEVFLPKNCRQYLIAEGKAYPKSSCAACGKFSPRWKECDIRLSQHLANSVLKLLNLLEDDFDNLQIDDSSMPLSTEMWNDVAKLASYLIEQKNKS